MLSSKWKVSGIRESSPWVKTICFETLGVPFDFYPGQYVVLGLYLSNSKDFQVLNDESSYQERSFSLSSNPLDRNHPEITVVSVENGFIADYLLNHLTPGTEVEVKGPMGNFYFDEKKSRENIVLIGAGSGVMPLISMATYIARKRLPVRINMLFSFRDRARLVLPETFEKLKTEPGITGEVTLTRESWPGRQGRINRAMIEESGFPLDGTDFYLCGPKEFKKDMETLLQEMGVEETQIFK